MAEPQESPLIRAPSEQSNVMPQPRGGSNKHALKVAGLTLLATVLIAGQAFTAYMAYSQKEKLNTLQSRSDRLEELSRRATVMRTPMKMALPMKSLPMVLSDVVTEDKKAPETPAPKKETMSQCQREAAGLDRVQPPSYTPQCDEEGNYKPQQCWDMAGICWCVEKSGAIVEGSFTNGTASCATVAVAQ